MITHLQCPICGGTERSLLPESVCEECGCDMDPISDAAIALNKDSPRDDRIAAMRRLSRCAAREVRPIAKRDEIADIPRWCTLPADHDGPHLCRHTTAPAVVLREPIEFAATPAPITNEGDTNELAQETAMRDARPPGDDEHSDPHGDLQKVQRDGRSAAGGVAVGEPETCHEEAEVIGAPVAWRHRYFDKSTGVGFWRYSAGKPRASAYAGHLGYERQPLYAAPKPAQATPAAVDALREIQIVAHSTDEADQTDVPTLLSWLRTIVDPALAGRDKLPEMHKDSRGEL